MIANKFVRTPTVTIYEFAILCWAEMLESFTFQDVDDRFGQDGLDCIQSMIEDEQFAMYFEHDGESVRFIAGEIKGKALSPADMAIERFRIRYREVTGKPVDGTDRAIALVKKHKDWRDFAPNLCDVLDKELGFRKAEAASGRFVAEWPNFQTWVNQRRFDRDYNFAQVSKPWGDDRVLAAYRATIGFDPGTDKMLTFEQTNQWLQKSGPFSNLDKQFSKETLRERFVQAHIDNRDRPDYVKSRGGLFNHLVLIAKG